MTEAPNPLLCACRALTACALVLLAAPTRAAGVDDVLARAEAPAGVVFEIVSGDENELARRLPDVRASARRLRAKFPGLPVTVVSHGSEQFSLLNDEATRYQGIHALASQLSGEEDVPVEVCGAHAGFRGKQAGDFPEYVTVVPAAPARIREYRDAGYVVILM